MEKHANLLALEAIFRNGNVAFIKTDAGYGFIVKSVETHEVHEDSIGVHGLVSNIQVETNNGPMFIPFVPGNVNTLIEYKPF